MLTRLLHWLKGLFNMHINVHAKIANVVISGPTDLDEGATATYTAVATNPAGTVLTVALPFISSATTVLSITSSGTATAKTVGSTEITVTDPNGKIWA
jgi:hypothetical protein